MNKQQQQETSGQSLPLVQQITSVLWPSFIIASLATALFFVIFDPSDLAMISGIEVTRTGGYTIGFFFFWLITSISCALTCYFRKPCPPRIINDGQAPDQ
ncbi:hypothetical protein BOW28_10130 [Solemya velum gill symbiont]|uniref:hypothetical protein n=1 Tax=Solemya velum gill symbiont TaxID=2340 RepID=UPI0009967689|nr:hypothetical protein [Solemya velum gill symbiont]OOZ16526.1 hypothetical protein BOW28_10130 [Solemya velum gill symbiont]OOZ26013.1 hypothetical protein BOW32_10355 [Solemya velum gill symbiont]